MIIFLLLLCSLPFLAFLNLARARHIEPDRPPRLKETIPFLSNAWQFMTNKERFIERVNAAHRKSPVVQCQLGPLNLYFVTGSNNIPTLFKSSFGSEPWVIRILERTAGYFPVDIQKFVRDDTGCGRRPRPGKAGSLPQSERIWYALHRNYEETLNGTQALKTFAKSYQSFFAEELATLLSTNSAIEVDIFAFLRQHMSRAATRAMFGSRIIDINPGFLDAFWEYEKFAEPLAFGLPNWLNRPAVQARNRFRSMCAKWFELADQEICWDQFIPGQDHEWEPTFGLPLSRGMARWGKSFDFSPESMGPVYTLFIFALHSNTIPICTWVMMELIKDPDLLAAVKVELSRAGLSDGPPTSTLDIQQLTAIPLLQSILVEALRLHVGIMITRTSTAPVAIAGYNFPTGTIFQAPTQVSHLQESIWGRQGHPASEFWAYRHLKEKQTIEDTGEIKVHFEFSIAGPAGSFFPYGGGFAMCAGRNFAKAEVLLTVAMLVTNFDMRFIKWMNPNGSLSDRPALDNTKYANAVAAPPDREMRAQWQRV